MNGADDRCNKGEIAAGSTHMSTNRTTRIGMTYFS